MKIGNGVFLTLFVATAGFAFTTAYPTQASNIWLGVYFFVKLLTVLELDLRGRDFHRKNKVWQTKLDWVAEVYTRLKVTLLSLVALLISDFFRNCMKYIDTKSSYEQANSILKAFRGKLFKGKISRE